MGKVVEHSQSDDNKRDSTPCNLNISPGNDIFTVKANSGEFSLTKEEMQQVAEGLLPTGLKEKLTSGEIEELVNYSKSYERPQEETALYNPGQILIANALKDRYHFRTIPEIGTDKENIYCYNGQINVRAEELIKKEAHDEYLRQWEHILQLAKERNDRKYIEKMQGLLHRGPSTNDINEVLQTIRRTTFTSEEMNPNSHIPFKNGLLNLKTRDNSFAFLLKMKAICSLFCYKHSRSILGTVSICSSF